MDSTWTQRISLHSLICQFVDCTIVDCKFCQQLLLIGWIDMKYNNFDNNILEHKNLSIFKYFIITRLCQYGELLIMIHENMDMKKY